MKTILMLSGLVLLIIGCNRTQGDDKATGDTEISDPSEAIWIYDYNQKTEEFEAKQLRFV